VILLSDVRLSNRQGVSDIKYVKETLKINPYCSYHFIHNSTKNKRGVAILIKNSIDFSVEDGRADPGENFLACRLQIKGCTFILASVYSPNESDQQFFTHLMDNITSLGQHAIIIGGDWNCLWSKSSIGVNIDALNMVSLPNIQNSKKLREISELLDITDPFRVLHPNRREFSYIPRQVGRINKSRLDFFVVSNAIVDKLADCSISPHLQNKLFDQKAVFLSFCKKKRTHKNLKIHPATLKEEELDIIVNITAYETYVRHTEEIGINKEQLLSMLARNRVRYREVFPLGIGLLVT
jgi:exonuclease III